MDTSLTNPSKQDSMGWTKEEYDAMQNKAHELGMHLITPYRKNLKNIRVGVISLPPERKPNHE